MQSRQRATPKWKIRSAAAILLLMAAVTIGLGIAGDAGAVDDPKLQRKAEKKAIKPKNVAPVPNQSQAKPTTGPNREAPKTPTNAANANPKNTTANVANPKSATANVANPKNATANVANPKSATANVANPKNANVTGPKNALPKNANLGATNLRAGPASAAFAPRGGSRIANARTFTERRTLQIDHRRELTLTRLRLPRMPLPGERGFTGVPPVTERRYVSTEMVFHVGPNVSQQVIDNAARRLGLTSLGSQSSTLTGGTLLHFRVADGRAVADIVRALEAERIGTAQPNYVFQLNESASPTDQPAGGSSEQYVVDKLRLEEVHKIATGSNVLVAVIDSQIDIRHPDLADSAIEQFDAVGRAEPPHAHGTGMVGAIAAHRKLMGIAPGVKVLAVHAFSTTTRQTPEATTRQILAGLEWAISKGARIINMSFAGPYDPMLQLAMKKASDRGVVLIAAAGNAGPKSPPLYPAADRHVIAVTATDENDRLFSQANQGAYVAVAAPGVDITVPGPDGTYQLTTGTSVAAAHVSGVAALLIERHPTVDAATVLEVLTSSARKLGAKSRDDQFGWGLVDPASALEELDVRMADNQVATAMPPAAPKSAPVAPKATPAAAKPAAVVPRPAVIVR
jgi:subtilisin family serine protease